MASAIADPLRCMPGMHHRVCQQAIFVLVPRPARQNLRASSDFVASGIVAKSCCGTGVTGWVFAPEREAAFSAIGVGACAHPSAANSEGKIRRKKGAKKRFMTKHPTFFQRRRIESSLKL